MPIEKILWRSHIVTVHFLLLGASLRLYILSERELQILKGKIELHKSIQDIVDRLNNQPSVT